MPKPTTSHLLNLKSKMPFKMMAAIKAELLEKHGIKPWLPDEVLLGRVGKWDERHDIIVKTVEDALTGRGISFKK